MCRSPCCFAPRFLFSLSLFCLSSVPVPVLLVLFLFSLSPDLTGPTCGPLCLSNLISNLISHVCIKCALSLPRNRRDGMPDNPLLDYPPSNLRERVRQDNEWTRGLERIARRLFRKTAGFFGARIIYGSESDSEHEDPEKNRGESQLKNVPTTAGFYLLT